MNLESNVDPLRQPVPEWLDRKAFADCTTPSAACGNPLPDSWRFDSRFDSGLYATLAPGSFRLDQ